MENQVGNTRILTRLVAAVVLGCSGLCCLGVKETLLGEELVGASADGDVQHMAVLIQMGANVNFDFEGEHPLTAAASNNQLRAVQVLLAKGADPNQTNANNILPQDLTADPEIARILNAAR